MPLNPKLGAKRIARQKRILKKLEVFNHPAFKRSLPPFEVRKKALDYLRTHLNFDTFNGLKEAKVYDYHPGVITMSTGRVRVFEFGGAKFIIKNTHGEPHQGFSSNPSTHSMRIFMRAHHREFRRTKKQKSAKYILRTPQLFGFVGDFAVMEYIKEWLPKTRAEQVLLENAQEEMGAYLLELENKLVKENYADLKKYKTDIYVGRLPNPRALTENYLQHLSPQAFHCIPTGIYKGKVVFYSVYDYS